MKKTCYSCKYHKLTESNVTVICSNFISENYGKTVVANFPCSNYSKADHPNFGSGVPYNKF